MRRETTPSDRRVKKVYLTEVGKSYEPRIRDIQKRWIEAMHDGFDEKEIEIFLKHLDRMVERAKELNQFEQ